MKKSIVYVVGGVLAASLLAGCGHFRATPEEKAAHIVEEIQEELKLEDTQLAKLNALKDHILALRKEHKETKAKTHEELRALLDSPVLDQRAVLAHITPKTNTVNEKTPKVVALIGHFYDNLNEIQQAEIRERVDKFSKRHKRWHHD